MSSYENPRQITKYQTADKVLEFNDEMVMAPVESAGNIHARYSKIRIVVVDISNGKGQDAVVTTANVDPIKVKRLYEKVSNIRHTTEQSTTGNKESRIGIGDYRNMTPSEVLLKYGEEAIKQLEGLIPIFEKNVDKYPANITKIEEIKAAIEAYKKGELK